ncbi:hypothetical protein ED733_004802 [Metarhizium rileyi]|uniref:DUF7029 domain-containing protein n=1 Tax=Metarhizium rileyi (strain RCEF 4871) TaxID=1649241 RepID=A0A5C6G638_METRR|nr:hypothetical protein ED733_004802 [Metarhizium rileyi]
MLPVAFAVALFLGVAPPAVADGPRYSLGNSTSNATETHSEPLVVWKTVTHVVTASPEPECAGELAGHPKPTPAESPTATFVNTAPTATLTPQVHWSYDTREVKNVIPVEPNKGNELYYGVSDPSKSGYYAFVTYHFKSPSVNIDHTDHMVAEYHEQRGMTVSFNNQEAFKHALDTWNTTNDGLVLIAYTKGCGEYAKGERCYFNVTDIEYKKETMVIVAKGVSMHPDQITNSGETEWGYWNAKKDKSRASASGSGHDGFTWGSAAASASASSPSDASSGFSKPLGQLECVAPVDDIHGLPTACLGSNFDQMLDKDLGYAELSAESRRFLDGFLSLPGSNTTGSANSTLSARAQRMRRRSLARRSLWSSMGNFFTKASTAVYSAVESVMSIGGSFDRDMSFKVPDPASTNKWATTLLGDLTQTQSPWGDAILLTSLGSPDAVGDDDDVMYMNIYCVGCGASGYARVAGRARWSPLAGLKEGRLELQANMQFVLKLGIDADFSYRQDFVHDLFNYGLPALSFGVVTIGPYVSVGARVGVEAAARGKVLVGAEMGMQDSLVVMDLVNPSENKNSGWDPYFKPVFEASGQVSLSAELGLPVGIKCGLKISSWEKAVGVVDEPSIKGLAMASGSANLGAAGKLQGVWGNSDGCEGVLTQLSWRNKLWVGVVEADDAPLLDTKDSVFKDSKPARRDVVGAPPSSTRIPSKTQQTTTNLTGSKSKSKSESLRVTYSVESVPAALYSSNVTSLNHRLSPLVNPTGSTRVVSCANGNVYAVRNDNHDNEYCFGSWDTTGESGVVYDGVRRSLHYYGNTMSKLGVSRLRASDSAEVPRTSVTVALVPYRNPRGDDLYVVMDDTQQVLFPVVCDFAEQAASRLFVVKDAAAGLEMLERRDIMYSVTGGEISKCHLLALKP